MDCVFAILSCLFLAALMTPVGKGISSWLYCMYCFLVFCYFPTCCPESSVVHECIVPSLWLISCFVL